MAKSDGSLVSRPNTAQENARLLEKLRQRAHDSRSRDDLSKLFAKLNRRNESNKNAYGVSRNVSVLYGSVPGFPSGAWWGIRMDCSRDRVHDPFDADVHEGHAGVASVCTSGRSEDVDLGDFLTFTGELYVKGVSSDPLVRNYKECIPFRLVRGYNLVNSFAPKTGYRYDGLYVIIDHWIGVNLDKRKYNKFALMRLAAQEPSPWSVEMGKTDDRSTVCSADSLADKLSTPLQRTYKLRNCSYASGPGKGKLNSGREHKNSVSLDVPKGTENKKTVSESAIVMRHVFKKSNDNTKSLVTASTSQQDPLSHLDTQMSKAHSTNISIRMGLYDSSHSIQQDARKGALMTFCRTFKPTNMSQQALLNTENSNLLNKEKSRLDEKIEALKNQTRFQHVDNTSSCTRVSNAFTIENEKKDAEVQSNLEVILSEQNWKSGNDVRENESTISKVDSYSSDHSYAISLLNCDINKTLTSEENSNYINDPEGRLDLSASSSENCKTSTSTKEDESYDQGTKSQDLESLDSLTPDKILHLIDKKKYHPLSKLLIGNMIGLTSEESVILKGYNKLLSEAETKDENVQQNKKEENILRNSVESEHALHGGNCKFRKKLVYNKILHNATQLSECNTQTRRNNMCHKGTLRRDVCTNEAAKMRISVNGNVPREKNKKPEKKMETEKGVTTRLKALKDAKLAKQRFKSIKKHVQKKQRREIANLLIDAKIGPKVRGPRIRRLRCINEAYREKQHYAALSVIPSPNNYKIGMRKHSLKTSFQRRKKLRKVSGRRQRMRDRSARNIKYKKRDTLKLQGTKNIPLKKHKTVTAVDRSAKAKLPNTAGNNDKKLRTTKTSVKNFERSRPSLSRKRTKLIQTISTDSASQTIQTKRLRCFHSNEIAKPSTADAVIQCSLLSERPVERPLSRDRRETYDNNNDPAATDTRHRQSSIKIEFTDLRDIKYEDFEDTVIEEENYEDNRLYSMHDCNESHVNCYTEYSEETSPAMKSSSSMDREYVQSADERMSAFVPVNTLDSNLRIARLRSIGFKPIECTTDSQNQSGTSEHTSRVIKRDVAEEYNKYTNEETDTVLYMDEELQYQDIEEEDEAPPRKRIASFMKVSMEPILNNQELKIESVESEMSAQLPLEQDLESPWHGWKKVVTNEESYWIGW